MSMKGINAVLLLNTLLYEVMTFLAHCVDMTECLFFM